MHIWGGKIPSSIQNSFFCDVLPSMGENQIDESGATSPPPSSEYGDVLSDVLKDQARRTQRRRATDLSPGRSRLHGAVPPVLAFVSIWLWAFPPAGILPDVPSIPPADQEAGLRMEMFILAGDIEQYQAENGHLPKDLQEVGDSPDGVGYAALTGSVFRLRGQTADITVEFTSTQS